MASIVVSGDTSGAVTITAPAIAGTTTLTLPTTSGTILTTASTTGVNASAISTGTLAQAYGGTGTTTGYYGFKNRIINGAMIIDQRNAGASVSNGTGATNAFPVDRWALYGSQATKCTGQRNAGSVTPPTGFVNYLGVTSSSAYSVLTGDYFNVYHRIEGFNTADLMWGTANARTITLSFWVRSSLTGTFGGSLSNNAFNRSYPFTYTISSANTWEQKSLTIAGDTTGTWATDNSIGISVYFGLGSGSTYSGTAGAWTGSGLFTATGATSVVGTNGATFYITGVQLEVGSTATSFDYRPYTTELQLCQRYLPAFNTFGTLQAMFPYGAAYSTTKANTTAQFLVTPRTSPTGLTTTGSFSVSDGVTAIAATAVAFGGSGFNNCFVDITVASGLTQYRSVYLYTTTSNSQILFTGCEL